MTLRSTGCGLLLAAAGCAAALLVVEAGLRLLYPQPLLRDPDDAFVPDPGLGARLRPGWTGRAATTEFASTWAINADGHRGPRAGARGPAALRIAALGDSFTFGYGVEEEQAWPRLLESLLNRGRGEAERVEVLNLGVGGYGTVQEVLWLERFTAATPADLAIVALYVGNDPADNARELWRLQEGAPSGSPGSRGGGAGGPTRTERLKRWLGSRLHTYAFVADRADEALVRLGLRQLVYPFEMELLLEEEPPQVAAAWEATGAALAALARSSRARGMPVLVIAVPMKHQVSDAVWVWLQPRYGGPGGHGGRTGFDLRRPQRILAALCAREGLPLLDLLDGLRAAAPERADARDLYWPRDQHWSARGHEAAARLIADHLRREGLPRARP